VTCILGDCIESPINCDDGDPCTVDECDNGTCTHTPVNCDDGDPCTIDECIAGTCVNTNTCNDPPVALCAYSVYAFIDILNPDYNGPGLNNIYLLPASLFDDGSESGGNPTLAVKRLSSGINFDWTTNGACMDMVNNQSVNDMDKGKVYKPCIPVTPLDIFQWKPYKFKISDEYGFDECSGYYIVIPYLNFDAKQGSLSEVLAENNLTPAFESQLPDIEDGINVSDAELTGVKLFPNPGDHEFYLSWWSTYGEPVQLILRDITGKVAVKRAIISQIGKNISRVETLDIQAGTYIAQFIAEDRAHSFIWVKTEP
jgi:hypothetical protein